MTELQSENIKVVYNPNSMTYINFIKKDFQREFRDVIVECVSRVDFEAKIASFTERYPDAPLASKIFNAVSKEQYFSFTPENIEKKRELFQKFMRFFNCFGDLRDTSLVCLHIEAWKQSSDKEDSQNAYPFILSLWVHTARRYCDTHENSENVERSVMRRLTREACEMLKTSKDPSKDCEDFIDKVFKDASVHILDAYVEYGQYSEKASDYERRCYEIEVEFRWRYKAFNCHISYAPLRMLFNVIPEEYSTRGERFAMTPARVFYARMNEIRFYDLWSALTTFSNITYRIRKSRLLLLFCARFWIVKDGDVLSVNEATNVVMPKTLPKEVLAIIVSFV